MQQIRVEAPAKLNLHLQLGERRPDGFHDIESLFLALAFGDTLYLESALTSLEIRMNWQMKDPLELPPEKNIITRAVSLFRDRTGWNEGLKISVEKRIPPGGGLGGGSSDAAATLLGLNRLLMASPSGRKALNLAELVEIGAFLGSDVPFFLYNAPIAWVSGRGERVEPLDLPETVRNLSFVLVNPGFSSDTTRAFHLLDSWRSRQTLPPPRYPRLLRENLADPPGEWQFFNDFLGDGTDASTALGEEGIVFKQIINGLKEQGADFAGLSGSGSTCFGVFMRRNKAESVRSALLKQFPSVIITFSLAR